MDNDNEHEPAASPLRTIVLTLVRERRLRMIGLASSSVAGGLVEAGFLLLVTQSAFAITDGADDLEIVGRTVSTQVTLGFALVLVLIRAGLALLSNLQGASLTAAVNADMRTELATAFLRSNFAVQHEKRSGQLQELLTSFTAQGAQLISGITGMMTAGFSLAALLLSALIVSPVASGVVIVVIAVLGLILRPIRRRIRRESAKTASTGMTFATALSEISDLGMEMNVFHVQTQVEKQVVELIGSSEQASRRLSVYQGLLTVTYSALSYVAIVIGLGVLALFDSGSLPEVGAAMLVMLRSLGYGQRIQSNSGQIHASLPFLDTLQQELDLYHAAERVDHGEPIGSIGEIRLDGVSFEYDADVPVLTDVDAVITPCEVIGVIGPSGSGKSTLVQLLLGLRDPSVGSITAAGRNIADLSQTEWARLVTFVPQDAHLVQGTISENIRFYRDGVSDEDIVSAAKLANLHDDVAGFKDGYRRQVGKRGGNLSGGQQQRLIIARALVERPDVLILDEPTSSLDMHSESLIRQTLEELRSITTIVIIAHRMSTLDMCDRLMVIQDGRLKAFDTPENLELTSEFYQEALTLSGLR